jgi:hypothetical protein
LIVELSTILKALVLFTVLQLPLAVQSAIINLNGNLSAANQNGSDPALVADPGGIVPTTAIGSIQIQLDTANNTLDFQMNVDGILQNELRNFGPNVTPIHLHQPGGGIKGNFGPISIDLSLGSTAGDFTNTANGFTFERTGLSILLADQGNVALGMHPGDDQIVDLLTSGNMFVLVHSTKDIFTNQAPGRPAGFPFGEIRGNISVVPLPATLPMLGVGLVALLGVARRRA